MRNSIGGTWLLGIVLVFMSVFIAYIAISINYNHAFQLKTEIVQIIEENQGLNAKSLDRIYKILNADSYKAKGKCNIPSKYNVGYGINGNSTPQLLSNRTKNNSYNYCVYRQKVTSDSYYYAAEVFLKFNLPVVGDIYDFRIFGETNLINYPYDTVFR